VGELGSSSDRWTRLDVAGSDRDPGAAVSPGSQRLAVGSWAVPRQQVLGALLFALPLVLLAWNAWHQRWMSDDGLINLRVVDQVLAGNGPVFNAGDRVEAATSPLWIGVLVVGDVVTPLRLEWIAVIFGIGFSLAGLAAAIAGSSGLARRSGGGVLVPVGALCLAALAPMWDFSSSGLEGGLTFFWLGGALFLMQRWATGSGGLAVTSVVVGMGPLIRPDLALVSLVLIVVLQIGERDATLRHRLVAFGQAIALPLVYEVFRMTYYGALVPNTYFAKEGGKANWPQGWAYVRDFVGPYHLWLPVVGLALTAAIPLVIGLHRSGERRAVLVAVAFPVGGALSALAIVRVGGDFMHARLLLPSLFAMVAPVATVAIRRTTAPSLLVVAWAVLCLVAFRPPTFTADQIVGISDHRAAMRTLLGNDHPVTLDDFGYAPDGPNHFVFDEEHRLYFGGTPLEIDGRPVPLVEHAPDRVLLAYGVGAISYFAGPDIYVVDMLGLGDSLTARLDVGRRGPLPGHEKALPPAWVWARYIDPDVDPDPTLFIPAAVLQNVSPTLAPGLQGNFTDEVEAARRALRCPDVSHLGESTRLPLGLARIADNLSWSVSSFGLRVPSRPTDAETRLCQ
jgi:arabinofuranosyltransferase